MKLSFHGADLGVTGSCHLVECAGRRVLIDCGMYQGGRELDEENAEPFGFAPDQVDHVLLTHAHLDHCGRLPLLVRRGFHGEIITTAATRELARIVMLDSAHLLEEDARHAARHASKDDQAAARGPLFTELDALNCTEFFGRSASYGKPIDVAPGIRATFLDAGHILGSAIIVLELDEAGHRARVVFSGDLGNPGRPLLRPPTPPPAVDAVVMETTYGDRGHRSSEASVEELYDAVAGTLARGGNVIIPTFALERAQELLFHLRAGVADGHLPGDMQVFLDSPMAISATEIFQHHPECYDPETARLFGEGRDPFHLPGLHFTRETAESIAINERRGPAVIMAGSGMCTGGRVRHHLRHNLAREHASIVFVGYAARGTLARLIIDGAQRVRLFGEEIPVRARIFTINGFSAHADQAELLEWQAHARASRTYLVHGEESAMRTLGERLHGTHVEMPRLHQAFEL